jgi:ATP synthase protein I
MADEGRNDPEPVPEDDAEEDQVTESIGRQASRKIKARAVGKRSAWFGLGMFGMVGWSVAIPMLICLAIGIWLDGRYPGRPSWTLMMLFLGIMLGSLNAWFWLQREMKDIGGDTDESE